MRQLRYKVRQRRCTSVLACVVFYFIRFVEEWIMLRTDLPEIKTETLPGPKPKETIARKEAAEYHRVFRGLSRMEFTGRSSRIIIEIRRECRRKSRWSIIWTPSKMCLNSVQRRSRPSKLWRGMTLPDDPVKLGRK